jgi:hypothetical protein
MNKKVTPPTFQPEFLHSFSDFLRRQHVALLHYVPECGVEIAVGGWRGGLPFSQLLAGPVLLLLLAPIS